MPSIVRMPCTAREQRGLARPTLEGRSFSRETGVRGGCSALGGQATLATSIQVKGKRPVLGNWTSPKQLPRGGVGGWPVDVLALTLKNCTTRPMARAAEILPGRWRRLQMRVRIQSRVLGSPNFPKQKKMAGEMLGLGRGHCL